MDINMFDIIKLIIGFRIIRLILKVIYFLFLVTVVIVLGSILGMI